MRKDAYRHEYWQEQHEESELDVVSLIIDQDDYIIWVDSKNELDWLTHQDYDDRDDSQRNSNSHGAVMNKIALLAHSPSNDLPDEVMKKHLLLLGEALDRCLSYCYEEAERLLDEAQSFILERGKEQARYWQLLAAVQVIAAITLALAVFWFARSCFYELLGKTAFISVLCIAAGSYGAFLSIILRMGKEALDCHAGKSLHEWESRCKIFAGMI